MARAGRGAIFGGWILARAVLVRDGYGLGDVKLATSLGVLLSWASWHALTVGLLVCRIAVTASLIVARSRGEMRATLGPALAIGALTAVISLTIWTDSLGSAVGMG